MRKAFILFMGLLAMTAAGTGLKAQGVTFVLQPGWNWIGYPYAESADLETALGDFEPMPNDLIKSYYDLSTYYEGYGWYGDVNELKPGWGYMYYSNRTQPVTLFFGGTANDPSALPEEALSGEFTVDANGTKVRFSPGNLQCRVDPNKESQAIVGTGTTTTGYMPYYTYYNYSLCQMIYTATELHGMGLMAGPITGIAFQSESSLHYLRDNIEIWMSATTLGIAPTTSVSTSGMKKVFFGSVTQQTGWTEMTFTSSPFVWDGTSNLMVTVLMNHGSWNSSTQWQCSSLGFTSSCYTYRDSSPFSPTTETYSMNASSNRPNTRFNGKGGATWRFAEKQWDYIGAGNANISATYTGWFDLFSWGTSGHPHGAVYWQPWSVNGNSSEYYAYGDASYNLYDQTGEADWGCNAISNGGDKPNQWRTLTKDEWAYVINTRTTSSGKRYAKAQVNGVNGLILLPNDWKTSYYTLNSTNNSGAAFTSNTITATQWQTLEQKGAVFLPAGGDRMFGTSVEQVGDLGIYWTSSTYEYAYSDASSIWFDNSNVSTNGAGGRSNGNAVRLACQSNPRIRTIGMINVTPTSATANAEVDYTGTVQARGVCWNTTGNPMVEDTYFYAGTGTGCYTAQLTGLQTNATYYVRAYAKIGGTYRYGNTLTFTTPDDGCNGHEYVDLGLPSGLLWATCNIGATNPEDYGNYYAWGETTTKSEYNWSTYQYCNGSGSTLTKYCNSSSYGYNGFVDNITTLFPEDDAATANWGGNWRMPTKEEFEELYNNTTVTWTQQNGVNGRLFTATNGNSLFLPAAGYRINSSLLDVGGYGIYWSSSLYTGNPNYAWYFYFDSGNYTADSYGRYGGFTVRPVRSLRQD